MPWIDSYARSDGTKVRAHFRPAAGSSSGVLFGVILIAAASYHGGHAPADTGHVVPRPASTVHYPITFPPVAPKRQSAVPRSTVSYPIRFPSPGAAR